jgi:hypothetical protein
MSFINQPSYNPALTLRVSLSWMVIEYLGQASETFARAWNACWELQTALLSRQLHHHLENETLSIIPPWPLSSLLQRQEANIKRERWLWTYIRISLVLKLRVVRWWFRKIIQLLLIAWGRSSILRCWSASHPGYKEWWKDLPIGVSLFCVVVEWPFWGRIVPSGKGATCQHSAVKEWLTLSNWMNYPCYSSA